MVSGKHFILDVEGVEKRKLVDKQIMYKVLSELPEMVNMNKLTDPLIVEGVSHNPGLTGVVIIETSNIILHTFQNSGKFSLDIFSVKPIDEEKVISYLNQHYKFKVLRRQLIDRL